jgi:hypothetical protein
VLLPVLPPVFSPVLPPALAVLPVLPALPPVPPVLLPAPPALPPAPPLELPPLAPPELLPVPPVPPPAPPPSVLPPVPVVLPPALPPALPVLPPVLPPVVPPVLPPVAPPVLPPLVLPPVPPALPPVVPPVLSIVPPVLPPFVPRVSPMPAVLPALSPFEPLVPLPLVPPVPVSGVLPSPLLPLPLRVPPVVSPPVLPSLMPMELPLFPPIPMASVPPLVVPPMLLTSFPSVPLVSAVTRCSAPTATPWLEACGGLLTLSADGPPTDGSASMEAASMAKTACLWVVEGEAVEAMSEKPRRYPIARPSCDLGLTVDSETMDTGMISVPTTVPVRTSVVEDAQTAAEITARSTRWRQAESHNSFSFTTAPLRDSTGAYNANPMPPTSCGAPADLCSNGCGLPISKPLIVNFSTNPLDAIYSLAIRSAADVRTTSPGRSRVESSGPMRDAPVMAR